jgi:glucose/arabinose dehydrogenase
MLPLRALFGAVALCLCLPVMAQEAPFDLEVVAEGLSSPLYATAPVGDDRLFIVEQTGTVRILADGAITAEPFLDISGSTNPGGESGLLGLAFHPDYASNGRFYVNFTDRSGDTRFVAYRVSDDPNRADADSAEEILAVDQPRRNHNGGWIGFGPDGLLYVAMGDGGGAGDPRRSGQDPNSLLGKILRIDVDNGGAPEIFVSGVRNPWRNAFDGDRLYIADVGQGEWEEINVVSLDDAGANLGWNIMEGGDCFRPREGCDTSGLTLPVDAYTHAVGCSITGGYVYRGAAIPAIEGLYFFADYCSGILSSWRFNGEGVGESLSYADVFGSIGPVTSFGLDGAGEMYLITQDGTVRKFVPRG